MKPDLEITCVPLTPKVGQEISDNGTKQRPQILDLKTKLDNLKTINTDGLKLFTVSGLKGSPDMNGNIRPLSTVMARLKGKSLCVCTLLMCTVTILPCKKTIPTLDYSSY